MAHTPWIPHFGNHIPYTTEREDTIIRLTEALNAAQGEDARWELIRVEDTDDYLQDSPTGV